MPGAVLQPRNLFTTVNYHLEPERGGATSWCPGTVQDKRRPHEHKDVDITDIRPNLGEYKLDVQGFEVIPFSTTAPLSDFDEDDTIKGQYYDDVKEALKKHTGASRVIPVVHICRRKPWEEVAAAEKDMADMAPVTAPSYNRSVHVDQSYHGAEMVRESKLEDQPDAEKFVGKRWAIVNLWRSFNEVTRDNLAVCDARTAEEKDLVALYADLSPELQKAKTGYNFAAKSRSEAWEVKANPKHEWYYASNMTPNEALLIKQYDSKYGVAKRTPHTAISAKEDYGPTRQSMEVRCLLFWDDEPEN